MFQQKCQSEIIPHYLSNRQLPSTVAIMGLVGNSTPSNCGLTCFRLLCQCLSNLELKSKASDIIFTFLLLLDLLQRLDCFQGFCFKVFQPNNAMFFLKLPQCCLIAEELSFQDY